METDIIILVGLIIFAIIILAKTMIVVPQQSAFVVDRLVKFHSTYSNAFYRQDKV